MPATAPAIAPASPDPRTSLGRAGPLIAARLASALLTLAIPLVLARVMDQAEYGSYKLIFLVALTATSVLPCGVVQSLYFFVPRARAPRVYVGQTFGFMAAAGALGAVGLALAGPWLSRALSTPALADHSLELAAYTGLLLAAVPLEVSLTARGRTRLAALSYLASDALRAACMVIPVLAGLGLHGLMRAMIGFSIVRVLVAWSLLAAGSGPLFDRRSFRAQLAYALPFGAAILFAIPQQYAHQFIVAHAVGPALFAVYAVACFQLPFVDLFYTPTSEVLMVQLGELDRAGRRAEGAAAFRDAVERLAALILPPIFFVFAVAPAFITGLFGDRFAAAAPLFRVCLLAMPLGIWPLDAALRARGETPHILRSYVIKAAVAIPATALAVAHFGLRGAVWSYALSEIFGRALLARRVPRALSTAERRVRARALVPWSGLARSGAVALGLAALGATALRVAEATLHLAAATKLARLVPLAVAGAVFGAGYLLVAARPMVRATAASLLARLRARSLRTA